MEESCSSTIHTSTRYHLPVALSFSMHYNVNGMRTLFVKFIVLWDVTPFCSVEIFKHFGGTLCLHYVVPLPERWKQEVPLKCW